MDIGDAGITMGTDEGPVRKVLGNGLRAPRRVVFMGTPEFALPSLAALAAAHQVVAVYTRPDSRAGRGRALHPTPIKALAQQLEIPVIQPASFRRDASAAAAVAEHRADVIVVAAYGLILTPTVLSAATDGALNVHASLLPRWRGAAPIQRAILAGDRWTGVTIMRMDEGVDTGDILTTRRLEIGEHESAGELSGRLAEAGAALLLDTLDAWCSGLVTPTVQDAKAATLAARLEPSERRLDWRRSAAELALTVRALAPAPGAQAIADGVPIKILTTHAVETDRVLAPGEITVIRGAPVVGCGSGALELVTVQPAGRRVMDGRSFAAGRPSLAGTRLEAGDPVVGHA